MHRVVLFIAALLLSLNLMGVGEARADTGHHATHKLSSPVAALAAPAPPPADWVHGHHDRNMDGCDGRCVSCCATACGASALQIHQSAFGYDSAAPLLIAMNAQGDGRELVPPSPPPRP